MSTSTISVRIDNSLKANANSYLSEMGLSLGDYITMALTRLVYSQDIPFETKVNDPYVGRSGRIRLTSSIQEAEQGNYKYHELIEE